MTAAPVRCTARHPRDPSRECGERLLDAIPRTVSMTRGEDPPPACVAIRCPRCGTRYIVCPRAA